MDWGWIIILALAILGAGLIAGGVVSYSGSAKVGFRAFGAAAVVVGVVMWAIVLITAPVSHVSEGSPAPTVELVTAAEKPTITHEPTVESPQTDTPAGVANELPIAEAVERPEGTAVRVQGFLVADSVGQMKLCSVLLESYPPQCGGPSLDVDGLDPSDVPDLETHAGIIWSRGFIELTGTVQGGGLVSTRRETGSESQIGCTLQAEETYTLGDPVTLEFHLHNQGDRAAYVLTWYTPLEGMFGKMFLVTRDDSDVPYRGILAMRGSPAPDEYLSIEPGKAVSARVDLAEGYDLSEPGRYHVEFTSRLWDVTDDGSSIPRSLDAHHPMELPCNTVSFRVIDGGA